MMIRPPTKASAIEVCTALDTFLASPAPKNWEMITVAPEETPTKNPTNRLIRLPVVPTAANAWVPTYWPTTMVSTVL